MIWQRDRRLGHACISKNSRSSVFCLNQSAFQYTEYRHTQKKGWISILGTSDQRPDALCSKEKADFYRKKMLTTEDDDPSRRTNNKAVSKYVIMRYIYFFFFLPHAMHTWLDSLFTYVRDDMFPTTPFTSTSDYDDWGLPGRRAGPGSL